MSDDIVNIFIDNLPVKARKGQMIMQATDPAGIYIPRFCYHEKLSIAANCRMCLVEVEKAPKPMPACATPVAEGMKVFTKSPRAISAQKATMEFLLINHPLDCPICDQGGECELQDLAVGFGRDISRFAERKRVVKDKNLGPLVSTDMTRCIHCTRCVRFGQEIQGFPQLGTTGRGEHMEITTYVEQSVDHELSANIVDLCPVGALNNKPFRYRGRSWEMTQHPLVSPHDAVGTNMFGHALRGKLMRIVPRQNDEINETWIADRDRFGFEGIYADDRVQQPMVRIDGELRGADWETALAAAAEGIAKAREQHGAKAVGFLGAPSSTVEEFFLLAQIARGLGSDNIDHRLRQTDFSAQENEAVFPSLGMKLADVDRLQGVLVIGSNLRDEVPLLAHRVRKAAVKGGARVAFLNPQKFEYLFPVAKYVLAAADLAAQLKSLIRAAAQSAGKEAPDFCAGAPVDDGHRGLAAALLNGERRAVILGQLAQRHPDYQLIKAMAQVLGTLSGASVGVVTEGANAAGAYLAGAVPHRRAGGERAAVSGLDARAMRSAKLAACVLFGGIEPDADFGAHPAEFASTDFIVAVTPHLPDSVARVAHVVLPIGTFAEGSGTYVNLEGRWQSWLGAIKPLGESRPGWKVLRVLGNLLGLNGFEYASSEEVRDAVGAACKGAIAAPSVPVVPASRLADGSASAAADDGAWVDVPIYQIDALVRRSTALAKTHGGQAAAMVS